MSDGVLGLGIEYKDLGKSSNNNAKKGDYLNYIPDSGFISKIQSVYDEVRNNSFSLRLGANPKLVIGEIEPNYAQDLVKYPFKYSPVS